MQRSAVGGGRLHCRQEAAELLPQRFLFVRVLHLGDAAAHGPCIGHHHRCAQKDCIVIRRLFIRRVYLGFGFRHGAAHHEPWRPRFINRLCVCCGCGDGRDMFSGPGRPAPSRSSASSDSVVPCFASLRGRASTTATGFAIAVAADVALCSASGCHGPGDRVSSNSASSGSVVVP